MASAAVSHGGVRCHNTEMLRALLSGRARWGLIQDIRPPGVVSEGC